MPRPVAAVRGAAFSRASRLRMVCTSGPGLSLASAGAVSAAGAGVLTGTGGESTFAPAIATAGACCGVGGAAEAAPIAAAAFGAGEAASWMLYRRFIS